MRNMRGSIFLKKYRGPKFLRSKKYEQSASLMPRSMQGPSPWFGSFLGHFQHSPFGLSIFFLIFFLPFGPKKKIPSVFPPFFFFFFFSRAIFQLRPQKFQKIPQVWAGDGKSLFRLFLELIVVPNSYFWSTYALIFCVSFAPNWELRMLWWSCHKWNKIIDLEQQLCRKLG